MFRLAKFLFICFIILYFIVAACVLLLFTIKDYESYDGYKGLRGFEGLWAARFPDMVYGKAYKPWVYRTLLPSTVRGVSVLLPDPVKESADKLGHEFKLEENLGWDADYFAEYLIALILMFFCLVGFAIVIRALFSACFKSSALITNLIPLFALAGLPAFFKYFSYIYDFSTLFLFSFGLLLLFKKKWYVFYLIFILGCLNKETIILLTVVFAIHSFKCRMDRTKIIQHIALQGSIFAVIKIILFIAFKDNPGGFTVHGFWMFLRNINKIASLYTLPTLAAYIFIALLIFYKWRNKPSFLKSGLWIIIPLICFAMYSGYVDELRGYYEIFPIVFLLTVHSIGSVLGLKILSSADEKEN